MIWPQIAYRHKSRPETYGRRGQANNLAPFQYDILQTSTAYDRAGEAGPMPKLADNFGENF